MAIIHIMLISAVTEGWNGFQISLFFTLGEIMVMLKRVMFPRGERCERSLLSSGRIVPSKPHSKVTGHQLPPLTEVVLIVMRRDPPVSENRFNTPVAC